MAQRWALEIIEFRGFMQTPSSSWLCSKMYGAPRLNCVALLSFGFGLPQRQSGSVRRQRARRLTVVDKLVLGVDTVHSWKLDVSCRCPRHLFPAVQSCNRRQPVFNNEHASLRPSPDARCFCAISARAAQRNPRNGCIWRWEKYIIYSQELELYWYFLHCGSLSIDSVPMAYPETCLSPPFVHKSRWVRERVRRSVHFCNIAFALYFRAQLGECGW